MAEQRRQVAVLGAGIGAQHVDALLALSEQYRVASICDRDSNRAHALAARCPDAQVDTNIDAVISDPGIDLIAICLPPALHASTAIAAMDAGKDVACEKPIALSLADADAMIRSQHATGKVLAPVFQYRFGLGYRQLRHLVENGISGALLAGTLETHWNRSADYYSVPWRGTWAGEGGGAILGHAIHIHDLMTHSLGPVARVTASIATRANPIEVDDTAALIFELHSGAAVTSSVTLGCATDHSRIRLCFAELTAESGTDPYHPGGAPWTFTAREPSRQHIVDRAVASVETMPERYIGFYAAFDRHLRHEHSELISVEDGRRSIELVTAQYISARSGKPVAFPIGQDCAYYHGWVPNVR